MGFRPSHERNSKCASPWHVLPNGSHASKTRVRPGCKRSNWPRISHRSETAFYISITRIFLLRSTGTCRDPRLAAIDWSVHRSMLTNRMIVTSQDYHIFHTYNLGLFISSLSIFQFFFICPARLVVFQKWGYLHRRLKSIFLIYFIAVFIPTSIHFIRTLDLTRLSEK